MIREIGYAARRQAVNGLHVHVGVESAAACHERLESVLAEAIGTVFEEYVDKHGLDEITDVFSKGVKIEVGDMLPSSEYAKRLKRVPKAWEKAFEVNAGESDAIRASCVEFVLAGLYASDRVSRSTRHGRITYET